MNRRRFLAASAAFATGGFGICARATTRVLNHAIIGTGMRGQVLLKELLRRHDVNVAALCNIEAMLLKRALAMMDKAGKPVPKIFETLQFPDFTADAWPTRKLMFAFDDQY